jgi:TonB dependent receptor
LSSESKYELSATTYTAGLTNQFTNSLSNELRFGYASSDSANRTSLDTFGGAQPTNLTAAFAIPSSSDKIQAIPYLSVAGVGTSFIYQFVVNNHLSQHNLTDTFEILEGNHSVKLGIDYRHFTSPLNPAVVTSYAYFYTHQEMLANVTNDLQVTKRFGAMPVFNQFSAFVQDEWKVSQGLTLSAGIRWDLAPAPTEANGNDAYTFLGDVANPASLTLAPRGTPLWNTAWYNFAPRRCRSPPPSLIFRPLR